MLSRKEKLENWLERYYLVWFIAISLAIPLYGGLGSLYLWNWNPFLGLFGMSTTAIIGGGWLGYLLSRLYAMGGDTRLSL